MSVDEAVEFFAAHPRIHHALTLLQDVGPRLPHARPAEPDAVGRRGAAHQARHRAGAPASAGAGQAQTLYVLDEPTVGLHMADVEKLIRVLHRLVDAGNTVVVIEHNLDVIAEADWIIDLGPEGGRAAGASSPRARRSMWRRRSRSRTPPACSDRSLLNAEGRARCEEQVRCSTVSSVEVPRAEPCSARRSHAFSMGRRPAVPRATTGSRTDPLRLPACRRTACRQRP